MKMRNCSKYFLIFLIYILFLSLVLDMGGTLGIRNPILIFSSLFLLFFSKFKFNKYDIIIFLALLVIWPLYSYMLGITNDGNIDIANSQLKATVLSFVLFLVLYNVPYALLIDGFMWGIKITSIVSIFLTFSLFFEIPVGKAVLEYMDKVEAGYFGFRPLVENVYVPNIYFKSTLFFVGAFIFYLFRDKWITAVIIFVSLVAAVAKTAIIVSSLAFIFYLIKSGKKFTKFIISIIFVIGLFYFINSPYFLVIVDTLSGHSDTTDVRMQDFISFLHSLGLVNFLFGNGLGSSFFSPSHNEYVYNIEIDHINSVRKYGVIWFIFFTSLTTFYSIKLINKKNKKIKLFGFSLIITFLLAGTNPVLISPLFLTMLSIAVIIENQYLFRNKEKTDEY